MNSRRKWPYIMHRLLVIFILLFPPQASSAQGLSYKTQPPNSSLLEIDSLNVRRVGRALFEPFGMADINDSTLFIISYNDLVLFDISDPAASVPYAYYPLPGTPRDLTVSEEHGFVTMRKKGFYVLDRNDGYRPLSFYDPEVNVYSSVVSGNLAYLRCEDSLHIVDISDPNDIELVSKYKCTDEWGVSGIDVVGDTCYAVCIDYALKVLYMGDPANPVEIGSYPDSQGYRYIRVTLKDSLAYALGHNGLSVLNVSDLDDIKEIGSVPINYFRVDEVRTYSSYVYVSNVNSGLSDGGIHIYDASDPGNIEEVSVIPMGNMIDYAISGNYVFITNEHMLKVADVTDPANPEDVSFYDGDHMIWNVYTNDNYAYCLLGESGFKILNIQDKTFPVEIFSYDNGQAWKAVVDGNYAFIALGDRLGIFDINDINNPVEINSIEGIYAISVVYSSPYLYVIGSKLLKVVDATYIDSLIEVGSFNSSLIKDLSISGNYCYLACSFDGVRIIDISHPDSLYEAGRIYSYDATLDVETRGDYLYMADGYAGVRVIDVSDPQNPLQVSQSLAGYGWKIHLSWPYLYLSGSGMRVLDVSDPYSLEEVGYYLIATPQGIYSDVEYIYLGTAAYGFYVFEFGPVGIEEGDIYLPDIPNSYILYQNYPNPFNPTTTISFDIPGEQYTKKQVSLSIYNLRGSHIKKLVDSELQPGTHKIVWDGRNEHGEKVGSGVYFYRIVAGDFRSTKKLVVLK